MWVYKRCILLTCYAKMVLSELGVDLKTFCSQNGHHPRFSRYLRKRVLVVDFFKRRRDPKSHNAPYLTRASRQETNAFGVFAYLLALICCCLWLEYNIEHLLPISIRYPSNMPCRYPQFYKNQFIYENSVLIYKRPWQASPFPTKLKKYKLNKIWFQFWVSCKKYSKSAKSQ